MEYGILCVLMAGKPLEMKSVLCVTTETIVIIIIGVGFLYY